MEKLKKLYTLLIDELVEKKNEYYEKEVTIFSASAGVEYKGKIMIVGRAVNGWKYYLDPYDYKSSQVCKDSISKALVSENLNWVKEQWGNSVKYNTKKSAFWRLAKAISSEINPSLDFHTDSIVWTNLYKAAKYEGGNPSSSLMRTQLELAQQIFDAEIDFYKPSKIIFLTGHNWAENFIGHEKTVDKNKRWEFIEHVGEYRGSMCIVGQHPQGKNETKHLFEIVENLN